MTPDIACIEWSPARGPRRRVRFENRFPREGYTRIVEEWTGCAWRHVGTEPVENVVFE